MATTEDIIIRLRKRAEIRRQISTRKSVQEGKPDRVADLLEEAADRLEEQQAFLEQAIKPHQIFCEIKRWFGKMGFGPAARCLCNEPPSSPPSEEHLEGCLDIHCNRCGACQREGDGSCICYAR